MKEEMRDISRVPAQFERHFRVAFPFYMGGYRQYGFDGDYENLDGPAEGRGGRLLLHARGVRVFPLPGAPAHRRVRLGVHGRQVQVVGPGGRQHIHRAGLQGCPREGPREGPPAAEGPQAGRLCRTSGDRTRPRCRERSDQRVEEDHHVRQRAPASSWISPGRGMDGRDGRLRRGDPLPGAVPAEDGTKSEAVGRLFRTERLRIEDLAHRHRRPAGRSSRDEAVQGQLPPHLPHHGPEEPRATRLVRPGVRRGRAQLEGCRRFLQEDGPGRHPVLRLGMVRHEPVGPTGV